MFRVELFRILKNPINVFFLIVWPVVLLILFGELSGSRLVGQQFLALLLLPALTITIMTFGLNFASDKVEKRIKHYLVVKGAIKKYVITSLLVNTLIFEFLICLLIIIGVSAYGVEFTTANFAIYIFMPQFAFIIGFFISLIIGEYVTSFTYAAPLASLVFFFILISSGMTFPFALAWRNTDFMLEYLTPYGCMVILHHHISGDRILTDFQLGLTIALLLIYTSLIISFAIFSLKRLKK
ncbi:hypothetical protein SCHIN_v1c05240 [Spiroplasma chinense]|uniref:Transport permease protein n=1 Tax=Spiroplasma chinense TaxID=216932 RepID=A0A5B9Y3X1_9MOLU|nr:hypothetical protein [Spiroplasma chinense]QEH61721.1 hypothetical protein SCHIN_v1c05240 [Spiroplasma chinense]